MEQTNLIATIILGVFCVLLGVFLTVLYQRKGKSDEFRQRQIGIKLQNACPHAHISPMQDGTILIVPLFESPPGTLSWICGQCQLTVPRGMVDRLVKPLTADAVLKRNKRFRRLMKKHGYA